MIHDIRQKHIKKLVFEDLMTKKASCGVYKSRQLRGIHPAQFHLIQQSYHLLLFFSKSFETFEDLKNFGFSSKVEVFETWMSLNVLPLDA